jgi:hypothetical protein
MFAKWRTEYALFQAASITTVVINPAPLSGSAFCVRAGKVVATKLQALRFEFRA